jgi:dTDP-4-dehydrorhamnose 3,5-epimerase
MNITETGIKDLLIIKPTVFEDDRGYFFESFNQQKFNDKTGLDIHFVQDNQSMSQKGVLRGLHFQAPPFAQDKLVSVIKGRVLDVALDIRKDSPTYGQHYVCEISEQNKLQFIVPAGFAHGFVTLEDNTIFSYKCSNYYEPSSEDCIAWNDPFLNIDWMIENPVLSQKDTLGKSFQTFNSPF